MMLELHSIDKNKIYIYRANLYDISFGDAEDLINAIDIDHIDFKNTEELQQSIKTNLPESFNKVCPIILSIFDMTENALNNVTVDDLADAITKIVAYMLNESSQCTSNNNRKNEGSGDVPFYDILFELQISLCNRFNGLNYFMIRREKIHEVFLLCKRINLLQKESVSYQNSSNDEIIRRPAQDDSWF